MWPREGHKHGKYGELSRKEATYLHSSPQKIQVGSYELTFYEGTEFVCFLGYLLHLKEKTRGLPLLIHQTFDQTRIEAVKVFETRDTPVIIFFLVFQFLPNNVFSAAPSFAQKKKTAYKSSSSQTDTNVCAGIIFL